MVTGEMREERIIWLRYEFEQELEHFLHGEANAQKLAEAATQHTSHEEIEGLSDELLQHTFWAMQHVVHRPACWAPKREELEYLLLCLRDEEIFDPEQVEFSILASEPCPPKS